MARLPTPMRVEAAPEAVVATIVTEDIGMEEDMGTAADIKGVINLLVSRCPAASQSG